MARGRRAAAQAAAASLKEPIPLADDVSDDEMFDAPDSNAPTPGEDVNEGAEDGDAEPEEIDGGGTPARDSDAGSRSMTPMRPGRPSIPRKRRLGRPPKTRVPDYDNQEDAQDVPSDAGTPRKRGGRGRGWGRWGKPRGGPSHASQVPIDKEGNMLDVIDDEVALPEDAEGEIKVDKLGYLQAGREYRVRTFTILGRGRRLYMLSTEPARCIGFRDSYLFFQKHRLLYKIIIDEEAKKDLIDRELIPHSYKGRAIGVVTARSVFREFGARIIIGGKMVVDDYQTAAARARGDVDGQLAVPEDRIPLPGESYNRNQYVAWHGASSVYHSGAPSVPLVNGKSVEGKKRKITVTSDNWMLEHAREASRFNSTLTAARRENNEGVFDIHTNVFHYPRIMQPTHARWEAIDEEEEEAKLSNGAKIDGDRNEIDQQQYESDVFPKLIPFYPRNFMIHDIQMETAPEPSMNFYIADGYDMPKGLEDVSDDILSELPPECRTAFEEARSAQTEHRGKWGTEAQDGQRAKFQATTMWYP